MRNATTKTSQVDRREASTALYLNWCALTVAQEAMLRSIWLTSLDDAKLPPNHFFKGHQQNPADATLRI